MPDDKYYKVLGIPRDADDAAIKAAYRKMALKHHPDRNIGKQDEATKKFKAVSEAYEVLSDKDKRAVYDRYGEEGLKGGGSPQAGAGAGGGGGAPGGGGSFRSGGMPGGMRFEASDPASVFAQFFSSFGGEDGGSGGMGGMPFGRMGSMGGMGGMPGMGGMGGMGGMPGMGGMGGMPGMGGMGGRGGGGAGPQAPIKRQIALSLEDLYTGVTKRVKVTRQRSGRPEEKVLEIVVKPGWKAGTAVTFEHEGDETGAGGPPPADIVFVIGEKPHERFKREGNNLVYSARLPLVDALAGCTLTVQTLDGRSLSVPVAGVVAPGSSQTVRGEGMPISRTPDKRGDLIVKFDITFPRSLTEEKKRAVRAALS